MSRQTSNQNPAESGDNVCYDKQTQKSSRERDQSVGRGADATQTLRPRIWFSKTRESPEGKLAFELGIKVGYWPCLKGPFLSIAVGYRRLDLWYGLPSYWIKGEAPKEAQYALANR